MVVLYVERLTNMEKYRYYKASGYIDNLKSATIQIIAQSKEEANKIAEDYMTANGWTTFNCELDWEKNIQTFDIR